jgi:hypothetical protein
MAHRESRGKIIVFGILFFYPLAGVTYQFLHYLIGLRRLGYDPYYIEDSGRWIYDPRIDEFSPDASGNVAMVAPLLNAYGFGGRWAFRGAYPDGQCYGLSEAELIGLYRDADALLNVTGAQELREEHLVCPRRIYVESDPFSSQVKTAQGDSFTVTQLELHDTHFSFGENLGAPDCGAPVDGHTWLPTRQPIAMELWQNPYSGHDGVYTTITTWHNKGKDLTYQGETFYWTKDREFEKFLDVPQLHSATFELATGASDEVQRRLRNYGWRYLSSMPISRDALAYRDYIQRSRGEFTVARDQYVRPYTGWFSDRSACYLAAGRPVITQETGFTKFLPVGRGLFAFKTMEDILAALDKIESDYGAHRRAAQEIAAEYFATERVVGSLMHRAGL